MGILSKTITASAISTVFLTSLFAEESDPLTTLETLSALTAAKTNSELAGIHIPKFNLVAGNLSRCEPNANEDSCSDNYNSAKYNQGHKVKRMQGTAGYNACAGINTCGWDVYPTLSFVYWQANQQSMEYAIESPDTGTGGVEPNSNAQSLTADFKFDPGFKLGFGFGPTLSAWDLYAQWTRFHQTTSTSAVAPNADGVGVLGSLWSNIGALISDLLAIKSASADWQLHMDTLDFVVGRTYLTGARLNFNTYFGARALWIDQKYVITENQPSTDFTLVNTNVCKSWAIGPRFGLDTSWLLGCNFRAIGKISTSLLFTRYYTLKTKQRNLTDALNDYNLRAQPNAIRPNLELDLGLGWGSYFSKKRFHLDFAATYDFQVFWYQNMMYSLITNINAFDSSGGDLFLQGLTLTGRFTF